MSMIDYNNPNDLWGPEYDPYKSMTDEEKLNAGCLKAGMIVLMILAGLVVCCLMGSCTTTKYVPVIEHKTDTLWQNHTKHDSIWLHDSIHVWERADTVRIEKWHTKYVLSEVHDTTYISRTDSVPTPYPVEVKVPAELTWWQQTRIHIANILLYILGLGALFLLVKRYLKL